MTRSLQATGATAAFDFFILSDSTDPEIHQAERRAYDRLRASSIVLVYYRRRSINTERKPGNIADWVRRFGGAYSHMLVMSADSLMRSEVRRVGKGYDIICCIRLGPQCNKIPIVNHYVKEAN